MFSVRLSNYAAMIRDTEIKFDVCVFFRAKHQNAVAPTDVELNGFSRKTKSR